MNRSIRVELFLAWSGFFLSSLFIFGLAVSPMH
jgi:hypothetical protein